LDALSEQASISDLNEDAFVKEFTKNIAASVRLQCDLFFEPVARFVTRTHAAGFRYMAYWGEKGGSLDIYGRTLVEEYKSRFRDMVQIVLSKVDAMQEVFGASLRPPEGMLSGWRIPNTSMDATRAGQVHL
ncbi:MAG: hypothetical protein ABEI52_08580, partial [Halobacteriaceae archaeon]